MANYNRYRYGEKNPVSIGIASATVVEIGDLIQIDSNKAKPASDESWDTNIGTTQENFTATFLGVALQASADGDTDAIRVGIDGVYEYPCASASFSVGDLVGIAKASGNALEDQKIVSVSNNYQAVGKVVEATSSETTAKIKIKNVEFDDGYQTVETS